MPLTDLTLLQALVATKKGQGLLVQGVYCPQLSFYVNITADWRSHMQKISAVEADLPLAKKLGLFPLSFFFKFSMRHQKFSKGKLRGLVCWCLLG